MSLKSLSFSIKMDDCEVSRNFGLSTDVSCLSTEELVEALGDSMVKGLSDKPDLIKGMLTALLLKVEAQRKLK